MESTGRLQTIDKLDPIKNQVNSDNLAQFLSAFDHTYMDRTKPKGPDYLIIDNLLEIFGDFQKADLMAARHEAELLASRICEIADVKNRCDNLIWLKNLVTH